MKDGGGGDDTAAEDDDDDDDVMTETLISLLLGATITHLKHAAPRSAVALSCFVLISFPSFMQALSGYFLHFSL